MDSIYEWLYFHYGEPQLAFDGDEPLRIADALGLDRVTRLRLADEIAALQCARACAAFEAGVRLGLAMALPPVTPPQ